MRTADLDTYFETQRAHRDSMLAGTDQMIETLYLRIGDARVWIADLRRQSDLVIGIPGSPADKVGEWARDVAEFNSGTASHRSRMIEAAEALITKFEVRIADLRAYAEAVRIATEPLLGSPEDFLYKPSDEEAAKTAQIAAMLAVQSHGDRDFHLKPTSVAWSILFPWTASIFSDPDPEPDEPSKEAA